MLLHHVRYFISTRVCQRFSTAVPINAEAIAKTCGAATKANAQGAVSAAALQAMTSKVLMDDIDGVQRELLFLDTSAPSPADLHSGTAAAVDNNPLVILCGTAQSIPTWTLHLRQLAKTRRVLIPELRAQGRTTQLLVEHCTLAQHVQDLRQFLTRVVASGKQVDLVGFSLGGRIGLSFAEAHPELVGSISVTGVPHERPFLGQLILRSWLAGLEGAEYHKTSWSFFENGVTANFMKRNQRSLPRMVEDVMHANCSVRLRHLLEKALASGALGMSSVDSSPASSGQLRLHCRAQVIAADEDRLAGNGSEERLAQVIEAHHAVPGARCRLDRISSCGHLAPFERPAEWRRLVVNFLDDVQQDIVGVEAEENSGRAEQAAS